MRPGVNPALTCPACGEGPVGEDRCGQCGSPAARAERRLVALLFADLSGYTELCQRLDPEEVHLLIRPLMNALRQVCLDAGGAVPSIQGDGFMAVFGATAAREDDATRAVGAAVQLQRLMHERRQVLDVLPELHAALHVGEVVTAPSWETSGMSLSGDAVNVASRLCGIAGPGEILVSQEAIGLSDDALEWGGVREVALRGRSATVPVRSLLWRALPDVPTIGRWSSTLAFVPRPGPQRELALLAAKGHVVVQGRAGDGKSRLAQSFAASGTWVSLVAGSVPLPHLTELLAAALEDRSTRPELVALLRGTSPREQGPLAELALVQAASRALGEGGHPLIVLDNAERLPAEDHFLLRGLLDVPQPRWLVVSRNSLPELGFQELFVGGLNDSETTALVESILPGASEQLLAAVVHRAGNSPLYLEQCARMLVESGAAHVGAAGSRLLQPELLRQVPTQMRMFVSARLDLLPHPCREVLRVASVLGDQPDTALLDHLLGGAARQVDELVERGLLLWGAKGDTASKPTLRFAHALVRDVAYVGQLRQERAAVHRAAAEWYAVLPVAQVLEAQAFHLEAAVELGEADCDLVRRTVEAMVLYARSIEEERTRVARDTLARADRLCQLRRECTPDRLGLLLSRSRVREHAGEELASQSDAIEALGLARDGHDERAEAEALLMLARLAPVGHTVEHPEVEAAAAAYAALDDDGGLARVEMERGRLNEEHGGIASKLAHLERAYDLAIRSGEGRLQSELAQQLTLMHALNTGRATFEHWGERAQALCRSDDTALAARLALGEAFLAYFGLDPSAGLKPAAAAMRAAEELGLIQLRFNAGLALAALLIATGRLDAAERVVEQLEPVAGGRTSPVWGLQLKLQRARLLQRRGRLPEAQEVLSDVARHPMLDAAMMRRDLAECRAWIALDAGRFLEAAQHAADAVLLDQDSASQLPVLRPRVVAVIAATVARSPLALADVSALRGEARVCGLPVVVQLANRWHAVDELAQGWSVDLHGLKAHPDVVEIRALDLEIQALSTRNWNGLLEAAQVWLELGATIWHPRALIWHSELAGVDHPEIGELLRALEAPAELEPTLRAQVARLKA